MSDRYAVIGNPIAHSKSPRIHALFAGQTGQDIRYEAIRAEPGGFAGAMADFRQAGGKGLNVTVPFKQEAWRLADERSERADIAHAVNTLALREDGRLYGDNTDGVGLLRDLTQNAGLELTGKRILVLGAGGAVRGVLQPLLEQRPAELVIANRTVERAVELASAFEPLGNVAGCGFEDLDGARADVVINGTSASLQGKVPPLPDDLLGRQAACYDMMYGAEPTAFMQWADEHGATHISDGLGMLVEQAAESFFVWRGVMPETRPVIDTLRAELSEQNT